MIYGIVSSLCPFANVFETSLEDEDFETSQLDDEDSEPEANLKMPDHHKEQDEAEISEITSQPGLKDYLEEYFKKKIFLR